MRKNKNITQRELAEQLGVSDKAVSKWECGNGMPDNVFMLPLCELLGISANELLAGRRFEDERVIGMKYMLKELYGLDAISMERVEMGAGTVVYIVVCKDGKYMIKYASENKMNHPEQEAAVCMHLQKQGIPAAIFVKNRHGAFLSRDENGRLYSVQIFQEGKQYRYHEAPDWLMEEQARMLGRIHYALKNFGEIPVGIGEKFFEHMTPEHALKS